MKSSLNPAFGIIPMMIAVAITGSAFAAGNQAQQKQTPQQEFPFNAVGTVTRHGVDTCMQGHILYDLNPVEHKTKNWLSTSSKAEEDILQKAMETGGWVRVRGTMMVGLRPDCKWVAVSSVTPVKKK